MKRLHYESINEIKFWKSCFYDYNGQPIWPLSPIISVLTYSDASDYGWGGYSVNLNGYVAKGNFHHMSTVIVLLGEN